MSMAPCSAQFWEQCLLECVFLWIYLFSCTHNPCESWHKPISQSCFSPPICVHPIGPLSTQHTFPERQNSTVSIWKAPGKKTMTMCISHNIAEEVQEKCAVTMKIQFDLASFVHWKYHTEALLRGGTPLTAKYRCEKLKRG